MDVTSHYTKRSFCPAKEKFRSNCEGSIHADLIISFKMIIILLLGEMVIYRLENKDKNLPYGSKGCIICPLHA